MQLEQVGKAIYKTKVDDKDILLFMTEKVRKSNDIHESLSGLTRMLAEYKVVGEIALLPDLTPASSLPIGSAVTIESEKHINPNFLGMDAGCGYSLFSVDKSARRLLKKGKPNNPRIERIVNAVSSAITGHRNNPHYSTESSIPIPEADDIARRYLGTLGGGNHFVDLFVIDQVYDTQAARRHGLDEGKIYFLVHTGSRLLGKETGQHFAGIYADEPTAGFNKQYIDALKALVKYASANRNQIRSNVVERLSADSVTDVSSEVIFDVPHNDIEVKYGDRGRIENYTVRKGSSKLLPGGLAVIPGTCNSHAYLVQGSSGLEASNYSINHGVGRTKTRGQAFSRYARDKSLGKHFKGIVLNVDPKRMIEEIPAAYKKIEDVLTSVEEAGLATKVARLRPLGVIVERKN